MPKVAIKLAIIIFKQLNFTSGRLFGDRQFTQVTSIKTTLLFLSAWFQRGVAGFQRRCAGVETKRRWGVPASGRENDGAPGRGRLVGNVEIALITFLL